MGVLFSYYHTLKKINKNVRIIPPIIKLITLIIKLSMKDFCKENIFLLKAWSIKASNINAKSSEISIPIKKPQR